MTVDAERIYATGYDDAGHRIVTAMEQDDHFTFNRYDTTGEPIELLSLVADLGEAMARMRDAGAVSFVFVPKGMGEEFLNRLAAA
jgi:hypothetical protein